MLRFSAIIMFTTHVDFHSSEKKHLQIDNDARVMSGNWPSIFLISQLADDKTE
jgi:hypothetical protein